MASVRGQEGRLGAAFLSTVYGVLIDVMTAQNARRPIA